MKTYVTHLAATTTHGIYEIDPVDYPDADWSTFGFFLKHLADVEDGDTLFCAVDPEQLESLQDAYSVTLERKA
jgi:hypothetical protein